MPFLCKLTVVTPPAITPVTTPVVRRHCRIDQTADDELLNIYIQSATALIEAFLDRALVTQTLEYSLVRTTNPNSWPMAPAPIFILPMGVEWALLHNAERDIGLLRSPVQSVSTVTTGSWGCDDLTLVLNTDYAVDLTLDPGRIHLINGNSWEMRDHISITYTAGYGSDISMIPVPIKHAILLTVARMYECRGDAEGGDLPQAAQNLLWPYRLVKFGES